LVSVLISAKILVSVLGNVSVWAILTDIGISINKKRERDRETERLLLSLSSSLYLSFSLSLSLSFYLYRYQNQKKMAQTETLPNTSTEILADINTETNNFHSLVYSSEVM
jgi:hypothetical protein